MAEGEAGKVIHSEAAAEMNDWMRGFIKNGKVRKDVAQKALTEILISELERHGTKVRRKSPKVTH